eukprot:TRINITY_DN1094_c0_g1_i4.p1 TRINITY_DN1094_c0_g1~~TRINITY_DN1094_c0_g1_i4.p1  ORF type:complete len:1939 (-),score=642.87 TRINITY_DN1094_c0_g1_i4:40-5856(-)
MLDGQGYLIVNREVVSQDIDDFEYTPKPEYEGPFIIFNEADGAALLSRFFDHMREIKPHIYVTFNGDFFDWPFMDKRADARGMSLEKEFGVRPNKAGEYLGRFVSHLDAYRWVKRDSYLPQGSQGLKAVTKAKLGYDPIEIDPEDMLPFARDRPQEMASYSVSDAVATYYLYMKYVHPFIFSLCTILPMNPDDVLRKGSGTLCEALLMVEAFVAGVVYPNKQQEEVGKMYEGHLLESETYVGGHVECLESGVFRSDLATKFNLTPEAFEELIGEVDKTLRFAAVEEGGLSMDSITNYDVIRSEILAKLEDLRDTPKRKQAPLIYHLDVAAMYPNIILTNRLQPSAVVSQETCAACDFNKPANRCQRSMEWTWRGDFSPSNRAEYELVKFQLESEKLMHPIKNEPVPYHELPPAHQHALLKQRLKAYSQKVYKKSHVVQSQARAATVCQRENSFYIDTVRAFRDRRYVYKGKLRDANRALDRSKKAGATQDVIAEGEKLVVLYDSLQLAHKCILNSFYGYVMRRGARWHSMEMAGVVTHTGANIIRMARVLVEQIGRPLELDTDGIWCVLPDTFPENFEFETTDPKKPKYVFSYPCVVLNNRVAKEYTNDQYQTVVKGGKTDEYDTTKECSILFEVDGPYRAMVLPASKEGLDKRLKKRYAVFNHDGSLAELKGFELKRRGELKLIKIFQSQVFERFLHGDTLDECYKAVGAIADKWLDVLYTEGATMHDDELIELLSCSSNMSKKLSEYGAQKSTAITTAKRLAEFLGPEMVKGAGLACKFIIAKYPHGAPVTQRAVPVAIFSAEDAMKRYYLRRWCQQQGMVDFSIKKMLDWSYYKERLGNTIQKIITIPAAYQNILNPVPRCVHPEWMLKLLRSSSHRQLSLSQFGTSGSGAKGSEQLFAEDKKNRPVVNDIEDMFGSSGNSIGVPRATTRKGGKKQKGRRRDDYDDYDDTVECPDIDEDFESFLTHQKRKWRALRRDMASRRSSSGTVNGRGAHLTARGGAFSKQSSMLLNKPWQIVHIAETDEPGEYRVWALLENGTMHSLRIDVPRRFYVNTMEADDGGMVGARLVTKSLPRSRTAHHLYEFMLDESVYTENLKTLHASFNQVGVEGGYETQAPLEFRAVVGAGCLCRVDPTRYEASANRAADRFSLDELLRLSDTDSLSYLDPTLYRTIYLYHNGTGTRGIYAMVFSRTAPSHRIAETDVETTAVVFLVQAAGAGNRTHLENILRRQHPSIVSIDVTIVRDNVAAHREVHRELTRYQSDNRGATVVCVQSAKDLSLVIPTLTEFPLVSIASNSADNNYPALGWESRAMELVGRRFTGFRDYYRDMVDFAKFAQVPIGNLDSDYVLDVIDVFFSRALTESGHLLWVSDSGRPDLGLSEDDDNSFDDELVPPSIVQPGCHTTFCVEYDVRILAANALFKSRQINDLEGGSTLLSFDKVTTDAMQATSNGNGGSGGNTGQAAMTQQPPTSLDETSSCLGAFRVLRTLINKWATILKTNPAEDDPSGGFAELLIDHFFRYVSSRRARLYDPALHALVHNLMTKLLMQLLAEFRRLGSVVVSANFNKIIICTKKKTLEDAKVYSAFLLKTILEKDLFEWVDIDATTYWRTLLFIDSHNHVGVPAYDDDFGDRELGDGDIDAKWNIVSSLPEPLQDQFKVVLAMYLLRLSNLSVTAGDDDNETSNGNGALGLDSESTTGDVKPNATSDPTKGVIGTFLTQALLKVVHDLQTHSGDYVNPDGSVAPNENYALKFINLVCHVLSFDKSRHRQVEKLKRSLLKSIKVSDFAREAKFDGDVMSYTLPEVICAYCSKVREMDFMRDEDLRSDAWKCDHCAHLYNRGSIESRLVDIVMRRSAAYQLQDVQCTRCRSVSFENISTLCEECCGTYATVKDPVKTEEGFHLFRKIAQLHKFEWLEEVVLRLLAVSLDDDDDDARDGR